MDTKIKVFIAGLVGLLLAPAMAFAALGAGVSGQANAGTEIKLGVNFCTNLPTFSTQVNTRLTTAETKLTTRQQERMTDEQNRQTKRAQELAEIRAQADAERQEIYAKLTAKATTTVESQAVVTFKATIEAAVTTRRAAIDAAIADYWTGVASALSGRQAAVQTAEQNYATAIKAALASAQTECASGTVAATVRAHFAASVQAARTKFASDRKAIDKFGPQLKALAQTRNQAIQKAWVDFKVKAEKARADLKFAFHS